MTNVRDTLESIYFDSTRPVRFIMLMIYLLVGFHLALWTRMDAGRMHFAFDLLVAFGMGAVIAGRVIGLFCTNHVSRLTRTGTPVVGVIIWSFLIAHVIGEAHPLLVLMYFVNACVEVWILSRAFALKKLGG